MTPLRVVLDTNTLVSALVFRRDQWQWLRELWKSGMLLPLLSQATTLELIRVLAYPKFGLSPQAQESLLAEILPFAETMAPVPAQPDLKPFRDPKDQPFLELAFAARVELLITGDRDLLEYDAPTLFRIMTPAEFRARVL